MRKLLSLATLLVLACIAQPVWAEGIWSAKPGVDNPAAAPCDFKKRSVSGADSTRWCFVDNTEANGSDVSTVIATWMCENIDIFFVSELGDDATFANTAKVYNFLEDENTAISATDFEALLIRNATLDGDPSTATDTSALYGVSAYSLYVRFTTGENATTSRIAVACHPRS